MRPMVMLCMLCSLFFPSLLFALVEPPAPVTVTDRSSTLDRLLERAISQNLIAGGVVVVGNHNGILSSSARGQLNANAGSPLLNDRTLFDVASLTKVIATAPAVMKLLDEGRIALSDPVARWFPEFADAGHAPITIFNLLTHTSGLEDVMVPEQSMQGAIRKAAAAKYRQPPGGHFHYADINFILLGELVHRVTGETLDTFCRQQIYAPLGATETMFLPPRDPAVAIAPTSIYDCGIVQDVNARRLGGVAGHAGLFSSAYDLSLYARLMLGGGMINDRRLLSTQVVAQMTTPYPCNNGQVWRGLGWDMESPYSAPKGSLFSAASFGHTGYSGSSIWIDPQHDLFVILLTRRVNYHDVKEFNDLRRNISTIAAADFKLPTDDLGPAAPWEVARIGAQLLLTASPVVHPSERGTRLAARYNKWQHQSRAQRRAARAERRLLARAGGAHRYTRLAKITSKGAVCREPHSSRRVHRVTRIARAESGKTGSATGKRRRLVKS